MKEIRLNLNKVTESFDGWKFDMETNIWYWVICFWKTDSDIRFFFELPNVSQQIKQTNNSQQIKQKVKIRINDKWLSIEEKNINDLILKTKQIINGKKEK